MSRRASSVQCERATAVRLPGPIPRLLMADHERLDALLRRAFATPGAIARMSVQLDASRALIQRACAAYDAGERATRLISAAKLFATEAAVAVTGDAVQVHGGYG